jgi:anti-sigma regulatory factor (Ser/Thr protein kinase)
VALAAPTPSRSICSTLPTHPHSPREARRRVVKMCYGLSAETVATAQLLVSELVTNAVVHGKGPIGLRVSRDEGMVRVEISDARDQTPRLIQPISEPQAEAGRSLFLLDALANAWGTIPAGGHGPKTTWFELN